MQCLSAPGFPARGRSLTVAAIFATVVVSCSPLSGSVAGAGSRVTASRQAALPARWIGTWRLESERLVDQSGTRVGSLLDDPAGKLTYTSRGDV